MKQNIYDDEKFLINMKNYEMNKKIKMQMT